MTAANITQAGYLWDSRSQPWGQNISYSFLTALPPGLAGTTLSGYYEKDSSGNYIPYIYNPNDFSAIAAPEKALLLSSISSIENFSNITFIQNVNSPNSADLRLYGLQPNLYFPDSSGGYHQAGAFGALPSSHSSAEDGDLTLLSATLVSAVGRYSGFALSHEFGHTLGLTHETSSGNGNIPGFAPYEQNTKYSIMTYSVASHGHPAENEYTDEFAIYDIAALQMYYGWRAEISADTFSDFEYGSGTGLDRIFSIWDGGGDNDLISAASYSSSAYIDLRPGHFSSIGPQAFTGNSGGSVGTISSGTVSYGQGFLGRENVSIAFGAYIEDALGGSYADVIVGNMLSNILDGSGGDDIIFADGLAIDEGNEALANALGRSSTNVKAETDASGADADYRQIQINVGAGSIGSEAASYVGDRSKQEDRLIGGDGNDILVGSSGKDILDGGAGDDVLIGGDGDDELKGGTGSNILSGGVGTETVSYLSTPSEIYHLKLVPNNASGQPQGRQAIISGQYATGSFEDTLLGIEQVRFSNAANTLKVTDVGNGDIDGLVIDMDNPSGGTRTRSDYDTVDFTEMTGALTSVDAANAIINAERYVLTNFSDTLTLTGDTASSIREIDGATGDDTVQIGGYWFASDAENNVSIYGNAGSDTITGGNGGDWIYGGDDENGGGLSTDHDVLDGDDGDDHIFGGDGDDTIYGNDGIDRLTGNRGADEIYGGFGNDVIIAKIGDGDDWLDGGFQYLAPSILDGIDTIVYKYYHGNATIALLDAMNDATAAVQHPIDGRQTQAEFGLSISDAARGSNGEAGGFGQDGLSSIERAAVEAGDGADVLAINDSSQGDYISYVDLGGEPSGAFDKIDLHQLTLGVTVNAGSNIIHWESPGLTGVLGNYVYDLPVYHAEEVIGTSAVDTLVVGENAKGDYIKKMDFGEQPNANFDTIDLRQLADGVQVDLSKDSLHWETSGPSGKQAHDIEVLNAEKVLGGAGNDVIKGGSKDEAEYILDGGDGNDTLIGSAGGNILIGGQGDDFLGARGHESHMYGGDGSDHFELGPNAWVEDSNSTDGDIVTYTGIQLHGGINQWWMKSGYAYWAPFTALTAAFPVVGAELLYTASLFIDQVTMKWVRYRLDEDNTLEMDFGWGLGNQAAIKNYSLDMDSGKGTAGIAVFSVTRGPANPSDKHTTVLRTEQYVNLALYQGFGHGLQGHDPLVLDLDGDGYDLTTEVNSDVWFDFNRNGFAQHTGWVRGDDGFLVRDLNANGKIDDVSEMFGNAAQGGFDMLATFDDNLDGVINASDAIFATLKVWQDKNLDGTTDAGELKSLAELGIVSISLATTVPGTTTAIGHNLISREGSFMLTDGTTHKLADVVLDASPVDTRYLGDATVSSAAAALPQLAGFGTVKDLRVAMTQDAALLAQVSSFVGTQTNDLASLKASAESILYRWAGVDGLATTAIGGNGFDARKLAFLEKYSGTVLMVRGAGGIPLLDNLAEVEDLWNDQLTRLTLRLVIQGPLASEFASVHYDANRDMMLANGPTALAELLHARLLALPSGAQAAQTEWAAWAPLLGALSEGMIQSDSNVVRSDDVFTQLVRAMDGVTLPLSLAELAAGLKIEDIRLGTAGNDTLFRGAAGTTAIYYGGGGDDTLNGSVGQDVYVFGHSVGHVTINDFEGREAGDGIRFAFLNRSDVRIERSGTDLLITVTATGETIRVTGQFADVSAIGFNAVISGNQGIETIQFADGSIMENPEIMIAVGTGTDGNDTIVGTMHSDALIGGKGNDLLLGGDDADMYVVNAGDGQDIIRDTQTTPLLNGVDMLLFGDGLKPGNITLSRTGENFDDLTIDTGDGNSVTVEGQFAYGVLGYHAKFALNGRIEAFAFKNDAENWSGWDVQQKLISQEMTSGNDVTHGFGDDDVFAASAGNDTLIGYDGQDTYHWATGSGSDTIDEQARYIDVNVGLGGLSLGVAADVVVFDAGIAPGDLVFARPTSAPDLIITNTATGETLTVKNQFDSFQTGVLGPQWMNRIEWFTFADGTTRSWQDILLEVTTGGNGDDNLYGDLYADTLSGGAGNDYLSGQGYGDTYKFNLGDGQDTIEDANNFILGAGFITVDTQPDTLVLGAGITTADISFEHTGSDIKLLIGSNGDSVLLKGQDDYMQTGVFGAIAKDRIEKIQFADGTVWTWQDLQEHVIEAATTSGNDTIAGFSMEDTFAASAGDDLMMGGDSSDTYGFGYGAGHDEIRDDSTNFFYSNTDVVEFGAGVDPQDVSFARDGNDLVVSLAGSSDQLRITAQFDTYIGYQWHTVEQFKFADGTVWSNVDVQNKLLVGTSGNDTITGFFTEDVLTGGAGNDILRGGDGGDTYIFNRGDGQDRIEEGVDFANLGDNDTIQFGAGITLADLVLSRNGNDLIIGIAGSSDQITVVNQFDQFAWLTTDDVENFRFADGTVLSKDDVSAILLAGTSGDDNLVGTSGNDRLDGGAGNDTLSGGNGSDTYIFGRGYGQDTIIESVDQVIIGDDDRLVFKEGISASDLTYARDGNDLIISINGTSDSVRMVGEFAYSAWYTWNDVERFEFADGTIITKEAIRQQILTSTTTNHIVGFASDDTLEGGAGDDILEGGDGSDTYVFGRGSGHDSIIEQLEWGTSTENDTLRFKAGVAPGDVTVTRVGQDAVFTLDTGESVRVIGQFIEGYNEFLSSNDVEQVVFDDGTVWDKVEIARRSFHVSDGKDTVVGTWYAETIDGGAGDDTIQAGGGNDTLIGGLGNDQLEGGGGDDTYVYNPGDGNDVIKDENFGGNGTNRIRFGTGITPESLRFISNPADASEMTISFLDAAGSLKLIGQWGATGDNAIEFLDFADGTTWNVAQIAAAFVAQQKTAGNDTIYGYNGADVIVGGTGNDRLVGGAGDDAYVFGRGDGADTIVDIGIETVWGNQDGGNDRIELGANIAPTDVTISQSSPTDITLQINGTNDRLILTNAINDPRMRIEEVHFGNGTVWTIAQILAQSLLGTSGNDTLNGTTGSDIIAGGVGNDSLAGGGGNDYYRFGRGDGVDTIYDAGPNNLFGPTDGGYDTIQLGANITVADVRVIETSASDIAIQIIGTGDQLTLAGTLNTPILRIEAISFADGTYWTFADLRARALIPTSGDDVFYAGDLAATLLGGAGNDSLYGSNAADDLSGGTGNDALAGGGGDDIYRFGRGDGVDTVTDIGPNNLFGPTDGGYDTIQLGPNITAADVRVIETSANNIAIQIIGTGDQLNLNGTLSSSILRIEAVRFDDGTTWTYADLRARALTPTSGDDVLYAGDTPATMLGAAGNDTLYGSDGSDDLAGGTGNDTLYGGWGDDTYRFARGDGADYIYDRGPERWWGVENGGYDHVELATGIDAADIEVVQVGDNDIVLRIRGTSDQLTLSGTVTDTTRRIEEVRFADGTVWTHADLLNKILEQENRFGATAGDDHITATNGNETVIGLAGNDWINAREGNDILIGGTGNDDLGGGAGDDIYRFSVGDGQDRIFESIEDWVGGQGGNDRIELGAGITPGQVTVTQPGGGDLLLDFGGGDSILISRSPITNAAFAVEQVVFADGTIWTAADLFARSITPTSGADRFYGTPGADTIAGGAGNDRLNGREGNDILIGGTGNDDLGGGAGDDVYRFSVGDGQDRIFEGIDDWDGGAGGNDRIELGAGITPGQVTVTQPGGGDLLLDFGSGDSILISRSPITNGAYAIEQVIFADGTIWSAADLFARSVTPTAGDDRFYGTSGADTLAGGAGNDRLNGREGNDILIGGTGNDDLGGGAGDDIYRFAIGDGQDRIFEGIDDWDGGAGGNDRIELGAGIAPGQVTVTQQNGGNDLLLDFGGGDSILISRSPLTNSAYSIEQLVFADGTIWTAADLFARSITPTSGADTFFGTRSDDTISGGAGNDQINGRQGNDILIGGTGNDTLGGAAGDDIYRFAVGDGQDTILESINYWDGDQGGNDRIELGAGITPGQVTVTQQGGGYDLKLDFGGGDSIYIGNAPLTNSNMRVEQVVFADGTIWTADDLFARSVTPTSGADTFSGTAGNETISGGAGNDQINGRQGNDILIGGTGNDVLGGAAGDDIYRFAVGDGQDTILESINYWDGDQGGNDRIELGAGITPGQVSVTQQNGGNDLVLDFGNGDRIYIGNSPINNGNMRVEQVVFADGTIWTYDDLITKSAGAPSIIYGTGRDDSIGLPSDFVTADAGAGNDVLSVSGNGGGRILFGAGLGNDTLTNPGSGYTRTDRLVLQGLNPGDVRLQRSGDQLKITILTTGETFTANFQFWGSGQEQGLGSIEFANGTVWDRAAIAASAPIYGTTGNDSIGLPTNFATVDAGTGDDALSVSGNGGGRILFGAGLGNDTLTNPGSGYVRTDRLVLQGLNPGDVSLQRSGDQLKIAILSTGETFTANFQFWGSSQEQGLGSIEFANGAIWDRAAIRAVAATSSDDTITGTSGNDVLFGLGGSDVLSGLAGDDTIVGGDGDDTLYGDGTALIGSNLITNGSFEQLGPNPSFQGWGVSSDDIPGWTKTNSGHFNQVRSGVDGSSATDGQYLMDLDDAGGSGSNMDIRQTIGNLTAGQNLALTFDHGNPTNSSSGYFTVYWNGQLVATINDVGGQMRPAQINLVAIAGDNVLRFQGLGAEDGVGGQIDNVKLFATQPTSGNDILAGGAGNDILIGSTGNDDLGGGAGNDTYRFAVGDGHDRIFETIDSLDSGSGGYDRIELGAGILPGQVTVTQQNGGQDLLLDFGGGDSILLSHSPITNAAYAIEEVAFANGTVWTFADLLDRSSNAVPVFDNTSVLSGSATERSGLTGSSLADVASGSLKFTDANASDTHSVQVTGVAATGTTSGLASNATLLGYLGLGAVAEPASGSPGTAAWTFSAPDNAFDYLAAGETATFTYGLQVKDSHNALFDQNVTVTVTGANDAPVAAAGSTASGGVTEVAGATGSASNDSVGGSIKFADVDLSDLHSASIASVSVTGITSGLPANAVLLAWLAKGALVEQAGPTPGSLPWTFTAPDSAFDYLGAGQTATLTYVVQIADGAGGILSQNVTITATGTNDAPILASGTSATGTLSELASTTGSNTNDTASGLIKFADADTADVHSVTIASVAATGVTAGLPANAALLAMLTTGAISEQAGATPGSVGWTFAAADKTFDYLAAGQAVTLTYAVQLSDGAGGTLLQNVTISATGTNDLPLLAAGTTTGTIAELASVTGSAANDSASGALQFTDADTGNTHSATIVSVAAAGATAGLPANATLLGWLAKGTLVEQAGATPGSLPWTFTAPDSAFDYLSAGQAATLTYVVQIADGAGGTLSQNVVVTINGATDAPVIAVGTTSTGAITELASVTGSTTNDTGTGILKFTDVDAADTHTAAVASVTASGVTGGLPANATLLALLTTGAVTEQVGAAPGSIGWTFSAQDKTFDYLGAGQSVTLTYAVSVNDNHSGSVSQNVVVTVTGTNDAPVLAAGSTTTGAITELSATTGSTTNDTASGAIKFTDVDLSDVHTVTIASVAASGVTSGLPANAALLAMLAAGTVTEAVGATPGSAPWTFTTQDKTFDYLGAGQTATLTYVVQIGDGKGGSFSQNVVVTATGTNDAPVVTVPGAQTARTSIATRVTGISVADADANASETVTVTTSVGTIAATATGGATVGGSASKTMTISGTLAAVNSTLATLTYTAGASAGSDTIQVVSNDGAASNTKTIAETISTTANHGPVIDAATTATGSITELASTTNSTTADTATGSIKFTDADVPDTHTATITSVTASGVTSGLPVNATLLAFLTKGTVTEQSGTTPGSFSWTFSAQDKTFDYLGAGQTATLTYVVTVTDSKSTSTTQNVVINVTGTNDAPLVSTGTTTGAITERASLTGATTADTASGLVKFTDESADTHTATITAVAATGVVSGLPSNATLLSWMTKGALTEQAGATPGSLPWSFSAPDNAFDYLAAAQTATLTYTVQITDNLGAVLNQSVVVTITGSNDTPTAQAKSGFTTDNWTALTITGATLLAGVTDPDTADTFTLSSVQGATGGTVALTSGNAVFTPTVSAVGPASFTYTVSDGHSGTSTATVSITTTLHQTNGTSGNDTLAGNSTKKAQIDGLAGNDTITAGGAGDTIIGGAGTDTLTGGAGIDTFVYHAGFGLDTINSFTATGTSHDVIQVDTSLFADWAHLLGATTQVGSDLVITLDAADKITLKNVTLANFTSADAAFV